MTKDIVNLKKNARIEYSMVLTESEYEKYNQYSSTIDNDYCKKNDEDNCDDEKNYFKRKSYIGRTSYCDIIINSEEFINECEEHCIICSRNDKSECIICEYNYELSGNEKKKCLKQNQIISTDLITEPINEGLKTNNIPSQLENNVPLEITNTQVEVENLSSKLTILSSENTNIQKKSKITDISSEIMKSSELEEISTEIKTMLSEKTSLSNLLTQSSELSTYFSELKNKLSDKAALSSVIMNNLTNAEIYSELDSNILLKEDSSYYFNYTKQKIIKEKILNKNNS